MQMAIQIHFLCHSLKIELLNLQHQKNPQGGEDMKDVSLP